jgi:hypothetical protein
MINNYETVDSSCKCFYLLISHTHEHKNTIEVGFMFASEYQI